jgi:glycosyltransferase involved in cell wall biosynthesis
MKLEGGKRCAEGYKAKPPLISVVTVVYNDYLHLAATIQSVLEQNFDNFEYIIIDGGSNDGKTIPIIQSYAANIDYWCSEPDNGIYHAMQKGIDLSHGQYVVMKNAGDFFEKDALSTVAHIIEAQKPDVLFGDTYKIHANGRKTRMYSKISGLNRSNTIDHRNMFIKKEWLLKYPFDLRYKLCADYHQTLNLYKAGARFVHSGQVLSSMLPFGKSFSIKTYFEVYHIQQQFFPFPLPQINLLINLCWFIFLKIKRWLRSWSTLLKSAT